MNIIKKRLQKIKKAEKFTPEMMEQQKEERMQIIKDVEDHYTDKWKEAPSDIPTKGIILYDSDFDKDDTPDDKEYRKAFELAKSTWFCYKGDDRTVPLWSLDATDAEINEAVEFFVDKLYESYKLNYRKEDPKRENLEKATRELFQL